MASNSSSTDGEVITTLNPNDVILGRGLGPSQFPGNQQYLKIVRKHKSAFRSTTREGKDLLTESVVNYIRDTLGGRFVKEFDSPNHSVRVWREVKYEAALVKTRQALRDRKNEEVVGKAPSTNSITSGLSASVHQRNTGTEELRVALHSLHPNASVPASSLGLPRDDLRESNAPLSAPSQALDEIARNLPTRVKQEDIENGELLLALHASRPNEPLSSSSQALGETGVAPPASHPSLQHSSQGLPISGVPVDILDHLPPLPTASTNIPASYPDLTSLQADFLANPRFHHGQVPLDAPALSSAHLQPFALPVTNQSPQLPPFPLDEVRILAGALVHQATNIYQRFSDLETRTLSNTAQLEQLICGKRHALDDTAASVYSQSQFTQSDRADHLSVPARILDTMSATALPPDQLFSESAAAAASVARRGSDDDSDTNVAQAAARDFLVNALVDDPEEPRFTLDQEDRERACMTAEEHEAVLADVFGSMCSISPSAKRVKRPKSEIRSVKSLLEEMRLELMRMPAEEKPALLKALKKCARKEFSDKRMELFLRTENMDAKAAARRFALYWEKRRKWFGDDKFYLPMTLNGAFRDDIAAIQSGLISLLPDLDDSGRQISIVVTRRNTYEGGYTTENVLRLRWYVFEAASEHINASKGIVQIVYQEGATMWNFDPRLKVMQEMFRLELEAWPIKSVSTHVCHTPWLVMQFVRPVLMALVGKEYRTRHVYHDSTGRELVQVLGRYGIPETVLPAEMGGKSRYSHEDWLASRLRSERGE